MKTPPMDERVMLQITIIKYVTLSSKIYEGKKNKTINLPIILFLQTNYAMRESKNFQKISLISILQQKFLNVYIHSGELYEFKILCLYIYIYISN